MKKRTEEAYKALLMDIEQIYRSYNKIMAPKSINLDFEMASYKALETHLTGFETKVNIFYIMIYIEFLLISLFI